MRNTLLRKALEKKTENVNRLTSEGFVETVEKAKNMWIIIGIKVQLLLIIKIIMYLIGKRFFIKKELWKEKKKLLTILWMNIMQERIISDENRF